MRENPIRKYARSQGWFRPLGERSDALVNSAINSVGEAGEATKDILINSRLLGHTRHPAITDIPFGSWTVTLVSDVLEATGRESCSTAADISLGVGLTASLIASAGGLADLSETQGQTDRNLGIMHGLLHGVTTVLYGGSLIARRCNNRTLGRSLAFVGFGTLSAASYLASELANRRAAQTTERS
jgi:uncharacterized membrane protein